MKDKIRTHGTQAHSEIISRRVPDLYLEHFSRSLYEKSSFSKPYFSLKHLKDGKLSNIHRTALPNWVEAIT